MRCSFCIMLARRSVHTLVPDECALLGVSSSCLLTRTQP